MDLELHPPLTKTNEYYHIHYKHLVLTVGVVRLSTTNKQYPHDTSEPSVICNAIVMTILVTLNNKVNEYFSQVYVYVHTYVCVSLYSEPLQ